MMYVGKRQRGRASLFDLLLPRGLGPWIRLLPGGQGQQR